MIVPRYLIAAALAACIAAPARAGDLRPPDRDPPPQHRTPRDGREAGFLDRFIRQLADGDDAEYQRLREMHEQDPAKFRRMLADRRDQLRTDHAIRELSEFPAVREAIGSMPPNQLKDFRERLTQLLADAHPPPSDPGRSGWKPRGDSDRDGDSGIRTLTRKYHEVSEAERAAVLAELSRQLDVQFKEGEEDRARMIEAIEKRLDGLRRMLDERARNREEIIKCRLDELLAESDQRPRR